MNKFDVKLLQSVNGLAFGCSRQDLRDAFGGGFKEFRKTRRSQNTTDDYGFCHVFYTPENTFEAIEIFTPAEITVNGSRLPLSYDELAAWLNELDAVMQKDDCGITVSRYSIGVYAPAGRVESILFAQEGYYSNI